ncbi:hypothetical protein ABDK96_00605 [Citricoccus nitrophenolicus]|uniref:PD-(D/E)XK nuclease superfamily protein n=1 Tax=Citricoccus nitrophenolicus TaxID=863575 RepID=A0ABV0IDF4_9MICC
MSNHAAPWISNRGVGRLLAQETNVSDLIQFLSDRDRSPWSELVGFVPDDVAREVQKANHADLLLTSESRTAVVEVKLGHLMSADQQARYEAIPSLPTLYLAALSSDQVRVEADSSRWHFFSLSDLISSWESSDDELARLLAAEAAKVLTTWDRMISGVFSDQSSEAWKPLSTLKQKFLGRVVTRRIAKDLRDRGRLAYAGVTSGGGLPLVQGWTPVRGEGSDRTFMAEVRWRETKPSGELRFGVDFAPRPERDEDEEVRRAAYQLARSMDAEIDYVSLRDYLAAERPGFAGLLRRDKPSRPRARGDWEQVIVHGFVGTPLTGGKRNNRQRTSPDFFGDGTLRFQAIAEIDFERASARNVTDLIDCTLEYLASRQP